MKKYKFNKGITLVALIITIIILLILAGVAISQLTDSGLFGKAKLAKQKQENAEAIEDDRLKQYENAIINVNTRNPQEGNNNSNEYSTTEKAIGTWTNGETLYRKVISGTINSSATQAFNHNVSNIDVAFVECGYLINSNNNYASLTMDNHFTQVYVDSTSINIMKSAASNYTNCPICFVIQYTKKASNN